MWLYDPRLNTLKEMTLQEIADIAGIVPSAASRAAKRMAKLRSIGCYVFKEEPSLKTRRVLYESEIHEGEYWRLYSDNLEVSNFGRVRRIYKTCKAFVLPYFRRKYMWVKVNGKEYRLRDIVSAVYLKTDANKPCITHKNGDFTDCSATNLKRVSRHDVAVSTGGKARSQAVVLVDEQTKEIVDWWSSARQAAKENFMSYQAINDRCNGRVKTRKDGWFMWEENYEELEVVQWKIN